MITVKQILRIILPRPVYNTLALIKRGLQDLLLLPIFYRPIPNPLDAIRELQGDDYKTDPIVITLTSYYPRIKYCIPALKSLLKQNYPDYTVELNLWWDCKIPKNIQKFLDKHSDSIRVYILGKEQSKEDEKLQDGWSLGASPLLKLATTVRRHSDTYIAVCDDDIIHHPYWLSTMYYNMKLHKDKAAVGFSGYHTHNGKLRNCGMSYTKVYQATPAFWISAITGMLIPKHIQNKPDLLAHMARCIGYNKQAIQVDDVVIGSWLYCMGIPRLVFPRNFISRTGWRIPHVITLYHGQVEHKKETGKTIDETVWPLLVQNNLIEGKI